MYRVAICDDEPEVCTVLAEILDRASGLPELEITTYYEGETFCETVLRGMPFDLYILDIELPCINGVEVGQKLRNELGQEYAQLLYISGKERYAMQLFDLRPLNFLTKPFSDEKVVECVKLAVSLAERAAPFFEFKHKKQLYRVPYGEIRYFESRNKNVVIHTAGEDLIMSRQLSEINAETGLPENFMQVHQSFIINYEYVQRIGYQQMRLDDGTEIPISFPYRKKIQERIMKLTADRRDHRR